METLIQAIDKATRAGVYTLKEMEAILMAVNELTKENTDESNTNE